MSFAEASRPYEGHKYVYSGNVGPDGMVRDGGLGCSAYTSVVLHRMRDGADWLRRYDRQVHLWYGDKAAEHFGLKKAGTFASKDLLDVKKSQEVLAGAGVKPGALLFFNARKSKNGHVGFVRVRDGGELRQWHYSSLANGLYQGDFREWLRRGMYRDAAVESYFVPEK